MRIKSDTREVADGGETIIGQLSASAAFFSSTRKSRELARQGCAPPSRMFYGPARQYRINRQARDLLAARSFFATEGHPKRGSMGRAGGKNTLPWVAASRTCRAQPPPRLTLTDERSPDRGQ